MSPHPRFRSDEAASALNELTALVEAIGDLIGSATLPQLLSGDRQELADNGDRDGNDEVAPKVKQAANPHAGLLAGVKIGVKAGVVLPARNCPAHSAGILCGGRHE